MNPVNPKRLDANTTRLCVRGGAYSLDVRCARHFLSRLAGLLFSPPPPVGAGLLILRCRCVHTAFMRYPIDVLFLDAHGRVIKCVSLLKPWRLSQAGTAGGRQAHPIHALELAAGAVERWGIAEGDQLTPEDDLLDGPAACGRKRQRGAVMAEALLVLPILVLLGLALLQCGLLFQAKQQVQHAAFMAARAAGMSACDEHAMRQAYLHALAPVTDGGVRGGPLERAQAEAVADSRFEVWTQVDPGGTGARLHMRVTHGYWPPVPLVASLYRSGFRSLDSGGDAFLAVLVQRGRIPLVSSVTLPLPSAVQVHTRYRHSRRCGIMAASSIRVEPRVQSGRAPRPSIYAWHEGTTMNINTTLGGLQDQAQADSAKLSAALASTDVKDPLAMLRVQQDLQNYNLRIGWFNAVYAANKDVIEKILQKL